MPTTPSRQPPHYCRDTARQGRPMTRRLYAVDDAQFREQFAYLTYEQACSLAYRLIEKHRPALALPFVVRKMGATSTPDTGAGQ